jgi:nucleotide-binding universal stress UspA family protein
MDILKANKILIPIDFSDISLEAIKHAYLISKYCSGKIILLHVQKKRELIDFLLPESETNNDSVIMDHLSKKLKNIAEQVKQTYGINVTTVVSIGNITSEIIHTAEKNNVDIIIMGTRGKDSDSNLFIGSNSYRVLTKSKIPVMTVHSKTSNTSYERILIPIDTSEHTRQKVDSAIYLAEKLNSELYVIGLIGFGESSYMYKMEIIMEQIKRIAQKRNVKCITEIQTSVNRAKATLSHGQKINADLIIIMTDQYAEFPSIILGSYAHQLINESKAPVLCISPETHPEMLPPDTLGGLW